MPRVQTIPERQTLKLPDGGSTASRADDEVRRRRMLIDKMYGGTRGLGAAPANTTTVLGG
jgi:hypothetical protein